MKAYCIVKTSSMKAYTLDKIYDILPYKEVSDTFYIINDIGKLDIWVGSEMGGYFWSLRNENLNLLLNDRANY